MFVNYLQAQSEADEWFEELPEEEKSSWVSIEVQFRRKWLKQEVVRPKEVTPNESEPRLAPTPSETATPSPDPHHETGTGNSAQNTSQATIMSLSTQTTPQTAPVTPSPSPMSATSLSAQPSSQLSASSTIVTNSISPATNHFTAPRKRRHTLSDYPTTSHSSDLSLQTTVTHSVHRHLAAALPTSTVALPSTTTLQTSDQATFSDQEVPVTSETTYMTSNEVQRVSETQEMEAMELLDNERAGTLRHVVSLLEHAGHLPNLIQHSKGPTTPYNSPNSDSTLTNSAATLTTLSTTKDTLWSLSDAISNLTTPSIITTDLKTPSTTTLFDQIQPTMQKPIIFNQNHTGSPKRLVLNDNAMDFQTTATYGTTFIPATYVDEEITGFVILLPPFHNLFVAISQLPALFDYISNVKVDNTFEKSTPSSGKDPPYSLSSFYHLYTSHKNSNTFSAHIWTQFSFLFSPLFVSFTIQVLHTDFYHTFIHIWILPTLVFFFLVFTSLVLFLFPGDEGVAMFRGGHMEYRASALSSSYILAISRDLSCDHQVIL